MKILITAGPTRESIDPVRYLTNRSSGKMGYAIAQSAINQNHEVILVSGPVSLEPPNDCKIINIESADQMYKEVQSNSKGCDAVIMVAAVADYTPAVYYKEKIKKADDREIRLVRTKDILGSMRESFGYNGILVGFAAETNELRENAIGKMQQKGCNFIVSNDVSRNDIGFGSDHNEVTIFDENGAQQHIDKSSKNLIADAIIEKIETVYGE
ncbi:MAG: phosphopantothenoylcysteine decarboxylase [Verrucomicrobiales bacterium]